MDVTLISPPAPGSVEELEDLAAVMEQYENRVVPESLQERCDVDMEGMLTEYLSNRGISLDKEKVEKVRKLTQDLIIKLKGHFNRERPNEVAQRLGIEWDCDYLSSAQTPSYPSGHTIQAYVCATFCSKLYPEHSRGLFMIAELVSQSRIDRGVHFPSDVEYGKLIAKEITDQAFGQ